MRRLSKRHRPAMVATAAMLAALGCKPALPPSKPIAELTPREASGYALFQSRCGGCHYASSSESLHGPGLQGLYKKQYLPSGAPANDERVSWVILHGRNLMPAFGNNLDEQQLNNLLAYLHTL
jgi:mono/diheme cytochrome c family protein